MNQQAQSLTQKVRETEKEIEKARDEIAFESGFKAANDLYDVMYEKLSKDERYKRTGNYLEDVRRREEIHRLIEEEILNEIVYVD